MCELTTFRWSIDEDLHHYRRAGYTGIGLWRRKLTDFGVERGLDLLEESGLEVSSLLWAGGFTGGDERPLAEAVEDAARAIELAEQLKAGCLVLHTGGRNYHTHRHADRLLRSAMEDLLPIAEARGVTLAVEPMHPACADDWTLLASLESAFRLIDEYASPALRMVYDTYHFPQPTTAELADVAPRCALVHLADAVGAPSADQERRQLGAGTTPLASIVKTLISSGYDGFFEVELIGAPVPSGGYEQLVEQEFRAAAELIGLASPVEASPA